MVPLKSKAALMCLSIALVTASPATLANPFAGLLKQLDPQANQKQEVIPVQKPKGKPAEVTAEGGKKYAAGYSKAFSPVKDQLKAGSSDLALKTHKETFLKKDSNFLSQVEHGVVALDTKKPEMAIEAFAKAERILGEEYAGSKVGSMLASSSKNFISMITGADELTDYPGEAFERILMLNYKAIAYMLQGERKAYNVARRSIDWQNIEKDRFRAEVEAAKKELKKQVAEQKKKGNDLTGFGFADTMNKYYGESKKQATKLPSAYVNPFGFYMTGMVQEFDSYDDRSLRDNARISYKKALELNPKSKVLKSAVSAMKRAPRKGRRLIHVVIADGFAPEKRVVRFDYNLGGVLLPVKIPVYEMEPSPIYRFEIQTVSGKRLSRVYPVADIGNIALRHQYDNLPFQQLKMTVSVIRSYFENKALNNLGIFGKMIGEKRQEMANPDMRSWISLPEKFLAARLEVPKNLSSIRIKGFDKKGRTLVNKVVKLNKQSHNFVYARNIGKTMKVSSNTNKLWATVR